MPGASGGGWGTALKIGGRETVNPAGFGEATFAVFTSPPPRVNLRRFAFWQVTHQCTGRTVQCSGCSEAAVSQLAPVVDCIAEKASLAR